ncbi:MAG TPA: TatD family hydrolase [Candidatus Paceibacterota bacterium]|nr:TatD family hydrolase [Candidatus Paceibacterota bacterium]HPT18080.1 TatD family hydrolase [Candidatus Paceibacterota bacterium]
MPKYIDIHCHINFKAFAEDSDAVIKRALDADTWLFNVGSQESTSLRAIDIAHKYTEGVYACIGLHPIQLEETYHDEAEEEGGGFMTRKEEFNYEKYLEMAKDPKVVAIGECGLDYFHLKKDLLEKQKETFIEQIKLANEVGKPLMLHIRNGEEDKNAYADVAELLKKYATVGAVSHFFAGTVEDMKRFVEMGVYISFAGPVTYKPNLKIADYESVIRETPLEFILTDTDSPYVAPVPYRGKRNEPVYVREIVKKIAEIKNLPEDEVAESIVKNAKKLFGI